MTPLPSQSDTRPPPRQPVFNAMPVVVLLLSAAIIGATALQLMGPPPVTEAMMATGALIDERASPGLTQPYGPLAPLLLHVFLHGGWLHLFMNMTAMAAFGPAVALALGRGLRGGALFVAFFFVCAIGGGLAQELAFRLAEPGAPTIGASSALSGLLPAVGYLQRGLRGAMSISVPWIVINLLLAVSGFAIPLPIAWAAHLGGLAAGLVTFPLFLALRERPRTGPWDAGIR